MQKHWSPTKLKYVQNKKLDKFLQEIVDVCHKYGYCIEHEDSLGSFIIRRGTNHEWFMEAMDNTQEKRQEKK